MMPVDALGFHLDEMLFNQFIETETLYCNLLAGHLKDNVTAVGLERHSPACSDILGPFCLCQPPPRRTVMAPVVFLNISDSDSLPGTFG